MTEHESMIVQAEPVAEQPQALAVASPLTPQEMMLRNKDLVRMLAPEIQEHHLANIQGKQYMCVGGGIAIANSQGFTISVGDVIEDTAKGQWKARATLHNSMTGAEVAGAWGFVYDDEQRWMKGPKAARDSMTQTRAQAKLCRANFGHLYVLMGAATATPAEEMQMVEATRPATRPAPASQPSRPSTPAAPAAPAQPAAAGGDSVDPPQDADWQLTGLVDKQVPNYNIWRLETSAGQTFDMFDPPDDLHDAVQHGWKVRITWKRCRNFEKYPGHDVKSLVILKPAVGATSTPTVESIEEEMPF